MNKILNIFLVSSLLFSHTVFAETVSNNEVSKKSTQNNFVLSYSNKEGRVKISYLADENKFKIDLKTKDCAVIGFVSFAEEKENVKNITIEPENDRSNQIMAQLDNKTQQLSFISAKNINEFCKQSTHFFMKFNYSIPMIN